MNCMISFKAHYVQPAIIQKQNALTGNFEDCKVRMAELEPVSAADSIALKKTAELWGGKKFSFVGDISDDFENFFKTRNESPNKKFLVLTCQKGDLSRLKPLDILACAEVTQRTLNKHEIKYLEVSPIYVHLKKDRKLKHIGSAMLDGIKTLLPNKDIVLDSSCDGINFYLRNGFECLNSITMIFRGRAKKLVK